MARVYARSASLHDQSNHIFTAASDAHASECVSSISIALVAAAFAFGMASCGGSGMFVASVTKLSASPEYALAKEGSLSIASRKRVMPRLRLSPVRLFH